MTDYINEIAVDLDIYNKWPEEAKNMGIAYIPETEEHAANFWLVPASDEFPQNAITEVNDFPSIECYGKILWRNYSNKSPVVGFELKEQYRNKGIGKFICILLRTWVAENFNSEIFAPEPFRTEQVEKILQEIALEYNEANLVLKTKDGEFKPFGEIQDPETELGI